MSPLPKPLIILTFCALVLSGCDKKREPVAIPGFTESTDQGNRQSPSPAEAEKAGAPTERWAQLLDPDLSSWERYLAPEENGSIASPEEVFSVSRENGDLILRVSGERRGALTSLQPYANYHLSFEFQWGEKYHQSFRTGLIYHATGDHGEALRSWMKGLMFRISKDFNGGVNALMSVRATITADEVDDRTARFNPTAEEVDVGHRKIFRCEPSKTIIYKPGEWMKMDIYTSGQSALHFVNGQRVLELKDTVIGRKAEGPDKMRPLASGKILLLSEHAEFFVKNLKLRPITELPTN